MRATTTTMRGTEAARHGSADARPPATPGRLGRRLARSRPMSFLRRRGFTLVAVGLCAFALASADPRSAVEVIADRGGPVVLVSFLTLVLATAVDVAGFRVVCASMGVPAGTLTLARARVGIEAITLAAPGSALTADVAAPFVLRRALGLPLRDAVSAVLIRKWGILAGHAGLLATGAALGASFLARASGALGDRVDLRVVLAVTAAVFAVTVLVARALLRRDGAHRAAVFGARDRRDLALAALSLALWLVECGEVYVALRIFGVRAGLEDVLAMEALVSILKTVAFFLPGGLGVRELGHVTMIALLPGGSAAVGAAYAVLRRALEVVQAAIGFAVAPGARDVVAPHAPLGAPRVPRSA